MPDILRVARQRKALQLMLSGRVEDAEFDALRVRREHGEVHALGIDAGAQRPGLAGPQRRQ